jgi:hypothetical protein
MALPGNDCVDLTSDRIPADSREVVANGDLGGWPVRLDVLLLTVPRVFR